jgi:antitoxin ParD1/3/4
MTSLNISLPETLQEFIQEQVAAGTYSSASEYLQALVRDDQKRRAHQRLEALVLEGLESGPATPLTDADWDDMERRFDDRHSNAGNQ